MTNVVLYSGGADSTVLLDYYAGSSCRDYPIKAFSVRYVGINEEQMHFENIARKKYLELAKLKGYWIEHYNISIDCRDILKRSKDGNAIQPIMWMCGIMPFMNDEDVLMCGYISGDCLWHIKHEYVTAFNSLCALKGIRAELKFPNEWKNKKDIVDYLKEAKMPKSCWFNCEKPTLSGKACGECNKCMEIKNAK